MNPPARGFVLCVSGPSGSGKTSLCDRLASEFSYVNRSISFTTRPQRPGESSGSDYVFVSQTDFEKKREEGGFLETAAVFGNLYGTPLEPVEKSLQLSEVIVMDIDTLGAAAVKARLGVACVTVFILPPSMKELERRLRERRQNTPGDLERRLQEAAREVAEADGYDYRVVNEELGAAYRELVEILEKERSRVLETS